MFSGEPEPSGLGFFIYRHIMPIKRRDMKLISYSDYQIKLADEAFLVRPIRRLFHQDRSERKEQFWRQISFMYFMVSPSSSYSYILDLDERAAEIIKQEGLPEDFRPSELLKEAMEIYRKLTITPSQKLLQSSLIAADTVSKFLSDPTILNKIDDKGRPLYQISSITAALKNVEGIVSSLQALQKKVDQELEDKGAVRGSQELTVGDIWAEQGV